MAKPKILNNWAGLIATAIGITAFLPLIIHTTSNCTTESLAYPWLILGFTSQIFWLIFGYSNSLMPVICAAAFFFLTYLLGLKLYHNAYDIKPAEENEKDSKV